MTVEVDSFLIRRKVAVGCRDIRRIGRLRSVAVTKGPNMILGAEIGLLVMGIIALVKGKLTLSKTRVVHGTAARLLALIALLPLPLSFAAGLVYGVVVTARGGDVAADSARLTMIGAEVAILVGCIVALYAIGWTLAKPPVVAEAPAAA